MLFNNWINRFYSVRSWTSTSNYYKHFIQAICSIISTIVPLFTFSHCFFNVFASWIRIISIANKINVIDWIVSHRNALNSTKVEFEWGRKMKLKNGNVDSTFPTTEFSAMCVLKRSSGQIKYDERSAKCIHVAYNMCAFEKSIKELIVNAFPYYMRQHAVIISRMLTQAF